MSSLNGAKLAQVTNANPTAKLIYESLKNRKRARSVTDLRQFQTRLVEEHGEVNNQDYFNFWKNYDEMGVGALVIRRNQPPRFKWNFSLKSVVRAIDKEENLDVRPTDPRGPTPENPAPLPPAANANVFEMPKRRGRKPKAEKLEDDVQDESGAAKPATSTPDNVRRLPIKLKIVLERRNGEKITINLPADLGREEAQEIGDLIRNLR
jgi:hypothetical protein